MQLNGLRRVMHLALLLRLARPIEDKHDLHAVRSICHHAVQNRLCVGVRSTLRIMSDALYLGLVQVFVHPVRLVHGDAIWPAIGLDVIGCKLEEVDGLVCITAAEECWPESEGAC